MLVKEFDSRLHARVNAWRELRWAFTGGLVAQVVAMVSLLTTDYAYGVACCALIGGTLALTLKSWGAR